MRSRLLPLFVLLLGLAVSSVCLRAQLYWDINGPTAGAGAAPAGTWGADNFWSSSATGAATTSAWSDGSVAVFSAGTDATGSYTVTVSGNQAIAGLTVQEGTPTLTGGTLTFTAVTNFNITGDATIASTLAGTGGNLFKFGSGSLTLSGINTYTGGTHLNAGTLNLTGSISHAAEDFIINSNTVPTATLNITAGGDLTTDRLRIGVTDNTFSGAVNVSGAGSTVTNTNYLYVGEAGAGSLNILSGATVASVDTSIGNNVNGIGHVTLSGSGSTLSNSETLYVGGGGDGTLVVENGATVTNKVGVVGNNALAGASGYAEVTGMGSTWTSTDTLAVGAATTGDLEITDQGSVTTFNAIIGGQASVNGS
ncbi:MAG TPA: autotransporter-associated beta strand repeat-containing protein, partial [Lacunisphaera sp.]|nr:autotransporter-associated beta strand repeat-containing protein [Lacunisphaera sp.]